MLRHRVFLSVCIAMAMSGIYELSTYVALNAAVKVERSIKAEIVQNVSTPPPAEKKRRMSESAYDIVKRKRNLTKTILFWTARDDDPYWSMPGGKTIFKGCQYRNCEFTANKSRLEEADMLLFYCKDEPHFPEKRLPHQLYVHVTWEAPVDSKLSGYALYGDDINMTVSYRRESNLFLPYFFLKAKDVPEERYAIRTPFRNRSRSIAWLVSNCAAPSGRNLYVNELSKYIDVDVYGRCGNKSCDEDGARNAYHPCFRMFETTYKFYLAFENNVCEDYYTEKLLNSFEHELVPIVFGGADYESDFPRRSLINAADFPNPKHLAEYLSAMSEDEYGEYLQWKAKYRADVRLLHCSLCEFLHDSPYTRGEQILPPAQGADYAKWWQDSCNNEFIYELKRRGGW